MAVRMLNMRERYVGNPWKKEDLKQVAPALDVPEPEGLRTTLLDLNGEKDVDSHMH